MPEKFCCLVVSNDEDFREELVERAVSLDFPVRAICLPNQLPHMLQDPGFDWLILDLGLGGECLPSDRDHTGRQPEATAGHTDRRRR